MGKKIYLAIPYSGMEELSFKVANEVASKLMAQGHIVYSPISHNHPIAIAHGLPTGWDFWEKFDTHFIEWCDELHIVYLGGKEYGEWKFLVNNSKGVQAEIKIANKLNKQVKIFLL